VSTVYLPDTNVFSVYLRARDAGLVRHFLDRGMEIQLSSVVWFELRYGAERAGDLPQIAKRLELLRAGFPDVLALGEDAAWHAARVRTALESLRPNAQPIGPYDTLLAGHALSLGAVLVTHNTREFSRVPGLRIEDWQSAV
jgi:tRNA(fMet)-specific endonuclease VapC